MGYRLELCFFTVFPAFCLSIGKRSVIAEYNNRGYGGFWKIKPDMVGCMSGELNSWGIEVLEWKIIHR